MNRRRTRIPVWTCALLAGAVFIRLSNSAFAQATPPLFSPESFLRAIDEGNTKRVAEMLAANPAVMRGPVLQRRPLHVAAERGHVEIVKLLLAQKADPRQIGDGMHSGGSQETPLHLASRNGHAEVARLLIDAGADVNFRTFWGATPLQLAVENRQKAVARLLVNSGADVFLPAGRGGQLLTALEIASRLPRMGSEFFDILLTNKPAISRTDTNGNTLLHFAARFGRADAVRILLQTPINVGATNSFGLTALHELALARRQSSVPFGNEWNSPSDEQRQEMADLLLAKGAKVDVFAAAALGRTQTVVNLIKPDAALARVRDALGRTPLHWSVLAGEFGSLRSLLDAGAPVDAVDQNARLPLHEAAARGDAIAANALLEKKASTNLRDREGNTALHLAARAGSLEVVRQLVEKGSGVNAVNAQQKNALDLAVEFDRQNVAQFLMQKGALIKAGQPFQTTPLHSAVRARNNRLVQQLLDRNAEINGLDAEGKTPLHLAGESDDLTMIQILLERGADINARDKEGNTILHHRLSAFQDLVFPRRVDPAVRVNRPVQTSIIRFLLDHHADLNLTNNLGQTPLYRAALSKQFGGSSGSSSQIADDAVQQLIDAGADVNARDLSGMTPLHWAARKGNLSMAEALLKKKANVNARDQNGQTPLHLAPEQMLWAPSNGWDKETPNIVSLLLRHGADIEARDNEGCTPLHRVVRSDDARRPSMQEKWVGLYLAARANVNAKDNRGQTPLHRALTVKWPQMGGVGAIRELMAHGADVNARDENGQTPLHFLAKLERGESLLVRGAGDVLITEKADVDSQDNQGDTPLHLAARAQNDDLFRLLLSKRGNVFLRNKKGETPLLLTSRNPFFAGIGLTVSGTNFNIFDATQKGDLKAVTNLLAADAALANCTNRIGQTVLEFAELNHQREISAFLLAGGAVLTPVSAASLGRTDALARMIEARPDVINNVDKVFQGQMPLLLCAVEGGHVDTVKLLLDHKANPLVMDRDGRTPLLIAVKNDQKQIAALLEKHGADKDIFAAAGLGQADRLASLLAADKSLANARSHTDWTPLHCAAQHGQKAAVEKLLSLQAQIDAKDKLQWTPLNRAAFSGHLDIVKVLLENHAAVNATNWAGITSLHHAAMRLDREMAEALLAHGADINAEGLSGETSLFFARIPVAKFTENMDVAVRQERQKELIDLLIKRGAKERRDPMSPRPRPFAPQIPRSPGEK